MDLRHDETSRRFTLATAQGEAVLEYTNDGNRVDFTHTFVPSTLRGQGIAEKLVRAGLSWAKERGLGVDASCSYVTAFLQRHPELG